MVPTCEIGFPCFGTIFSLVKRLAAPDRKETFCLYARDLICAWTWCPNVSATEKATGHSGSLTDSHTSCGRKRMLPWLPLIAMIRKPSSRFCMSSRIGGFQGPALGQAGQGSAGAAGGLARQRHLSYRRALAEADQALGITVGAIARGRHGRFILAGICWVVERSFAWLSRYRRLNTIVERATEHLIAFVEIAFISIPSRRLKRVVVEELGA